MTKAPDKIVTSKIGKQIIDHNWQKWPSDVEYIRKDIADAAYERGRIAGLRDAASACRKFTEEVDDMTGDPGGWWAADQALAAIVALIPDAPEQDGWRDIASAPKEDSESLLIATCEGTQVAWWCVARDGYWANPINGGEIHGEASHWRPLPAQEDKE